MQNIIKYCTVALLKHRYNRNGKTAGVQHFSDFGELEASQFPCLKVEAELLQPCAFLLKQLFCAII